METFRGPYNVIIIYSGFSRYPTSSEFFRRYIKLTDSNHEKNGDRAMSSASINEQEPQVVLPSAEPPLALPEPESPKGGAARK